MAQWTPWRPLGKNGIIPAELLPATAFQLSWFLEWELDPMLSGGYSQHRGRWRWQVTPPAGAIAFDSEVDIHGTAIWFPGTSALIAWYIQTNANNPVIKTTVPVRPPLEGVPSDATSWRQRTDGSWANEAETGYIAEDGWVAGAGLESFPVYSVYETARYLIPLAEGSMVKVPFHTVGAFMLPKMANARIRTVTGGRRFGTMYDAPGFHRIAAAEQSRTTVRFSADLTTYVSRTVPRDLTTLSIGKELTNTLVVCGQFAKIGWIVQRSDNDGLTWRSGYELAFDSSYSDGRMAVARDGATVVVARKANTLWCRSSRDGFVQTKVVCEAKSPMELALDGSTGGLIVTDGKGETFTSYDNGLTWTRYRWDLQ